MSKNDRAFNVLAHKLTQSVEGSNFIENIEESENDWIGEFIQHKPSFNPAVSCPFFQPNSLNQRHVQPRIMKCPISSRNVDWSERFNQVESLTKQLEDSSLKEAAINFLKVNEKIDDVLHGSNFYSYIQELAEVKDQEKTAVEENSFSSWSEEYYRNISSLIDDKDKDWLQKEKLWYKYPAYGDGYENMFPSFFQDYEFNYLGGDVGTGHVILKEIDRIENEVKLKSSPESWIRLAQLWSYLNEGHQSLSAYSKVDLLQMSLSDKVDLAIELLNENFKADALKVLSLLVDNFNANEYEDLDMLTLELSRKLDNIATTVPQFKATLLLNTFLGKEDKVIQYCKLIEEKLEEKDISSICFMGSIYAGRNNWTAAIEKFEKALEIMPNHIKAQFNLARCFSEIGEVDLCKANLKNLLESFSSSEAKNLLDSL